jgi:RNA polymerase sigma-B factor
VSAAVAENLAPDPPTSDQAAPDLGAPQSAAPEPAAAELLGPVPSNREARARQTFACLSRARTTADPRTRKTLVDRAVVLNMSEAKAIARRYYDRGIPGEDLDQVAYLSLVAAANRFDPEAGHDFLAFARPTIRGEIKRHFRDRGWTVRPPRRIQDTQRMANAARSELAQKLGRSPTTTELADHLGVLEDDVVEAIAAQNCFTPASLDRPVLEGGEETPLVDLVVSEPDGSDVAESRVLLREAVRHLSERDRRILGLRFFGDLTQCEIAADVGLSQMQVSRILSRVLADLRDELASVMT